MDEKLAEWALNVKIRVGWCCEECGELERRMLEAHHIKPKEIFPDLIYEFDNGQCLCMWCHAHAHADNEQVYNKILARLCLILYRRIVLKKSWNQESRLGRSEQETLGQTTTQRKETPGRIIQTRKGNEGLRGIQRE